MTASVPETSKPGGKGAAPFPRGMRLLRHADFERVYKQGRRQFSANMTFFYLRREGSPAGAKAVTAPGLRVGFTVGRALGGAVERNRMKRRLREAVRLSDPPRQLTADVVINPKKSLLSTDFEVTLNEVRRAFVTIEQKLSPKDSGPRGERSSENRTAESGNR